MGGRNLHVLPVLRHGAARNVDALILQHGGDLLVGEGLGAIAYAAVAYWAVIHAPGWFRRVVDRAADEQIGATVESAGVGDGAVLGQLGRRIRWTVIAQGLGLTVAGGAE